MGNAALIMPVHFFPLLPRKFFFTQNSFLPKILFDPKFFFSLLPSSLPCQISTMGVDLNSQTTMANIQILFMFIFNVSLMVTQCTSNCYLMYLQWSLNPHLTISMFLCFLSLSTCCCGGAQLCLPTNSINLQIKFYISVVIFFSYSSCIGERKIVWVTRRRIS